MGHDAGTISEIRGTFILYFEMRDDALLFRGDLFLLGLDSL